MIGPYVLAAVGPRYARRLMLTGERISAAEAARIGLVHDVVSPEQLDAAVERILADLLKSGPAATAAAKRLIRDLGGRPIDAPLIDSTAQRIASALRDDRGPRRVGAFLEKRPPAWLG